MEYQHLQKTALGLANMTSFSLRSKYQIFRRRAYTAIWIATEVAFRTVVRVLKSTSNIGFMIYADKSSLTLELWILPVVISNRKFI